MRIWLHLGEHGPLACSSRQLAANRLATLSCTRLHGWIRPEAESYRLAACAPQMQEHLGCTFADGAYYRLMFVTEFDLQLKDCVKGMANLPNEHIDLVMTSPPYNLGVRYAKFSDRQDRRSYLRWCGQWGAQVRRVLKSSGSFFLNIGSAPSNPMLPHEIILRLRDVFVLQNVIHWIKSISIDDREGQVRSYGHFKPISSERFVNDCHEYIFHFTKTSRVEIDRLALGVPYQDKSNISRWSHTRGADLRCRGNTWFIPYETIQSRAKERPHPATFPVQLAEWCIKLHRAAKVQTMLDPFLGIGNSAIAAQRSGVQRFIGFEIDETYLAEARRRIG